MSRPAPARGRPPLAGRHPFYVLIESLGGAPVDWLGNANLALWTMAGIDIWQQVSFVVLILAAGLASLPKDPYEAAEVDGATSWQQFWNITLPMLRPVAMIASGATARTASGKISGVGLASAKTIGRGAILATISAVNTPGPDRPRNRSAPTITSASVAAVLPCP